MRIRKATGTLLISFEGERIFVEGKKPVDCMQEILDSLHSRALDGTEVEAFYYGKNQYLVEPGTYLCENLWDALGDWVPEVGDGVEVITNKRRKVKDIEVLIVEADSWWREDTYVCDGRSPASLGDVVEKLVEKHKNVRITFKEG